MNHSLLNTAQDLLLRAEKFGHSSEDLTFLMSKRTWENACGETLFDHGLPALSGNQHRALFGVPVRLTTEDPEGTPAITLVTPPKYIPLKSIAGNSCGAHAEMIPMTKKLKPSKG